MKRGFTDYAIPPEILALMKNVELLTISSAPDPGITEYMALCANRGGGVSWSTTDPSDISFGNPDKATLWPIAGTLKNLFIYLITDQPTGESITLTIMVNGVATSIQVVQSGGNTGNPILVSDTTHSFTVSPGDLCSIRAEVTAAGNGASMTIGYEFDPS